MTPVALRPCRIIPAYAGSTVLDSGDHDDVGDHPRIRGEHTPTRTETSGASGSSPHTRGARAEPDGTTSSHRIIPAYAGSTNALAFTWGSVADHPRIRGEHGPVLSYNAPWTGSSPHTRGAPVFLRIPATPIGIIPAYAGSTPFSPIKSPGRKDHPRIRGEHAPWRQLVAERCGIIPAYAGSTDMHGRYA